MTDGFPKLSNAARLGQQGVNLIAQIVNNDLGWLFRRTHNEEDFGIDGYIDHVTPEGSVTGRSVAVQIKYGTSFFKNKTADGFTYYGEKKHLNYLLNHPIPVVIVICEPSSNKCYWVKFDPLVTEATTTGWKITIPEHQLFDASCREYLLALIGVAEDHMEELAHYWKMNKLLEDSGLLMYSVSREEIEAQNYYFLSSFFDRLQVTPKLTRQMEGRVEVTVFGYDDDRRELYQILEVRRWFAGVEPLVKYWFFFLSKEFHSSTLRLLTMCVCDVQALKRSRKDKRSGVVTVSVDEQALNDFRTRNFLWLNELTEKLGVSEEENKRISLNVWRILLTNRSNKQEVEKFLNKWK